MYKTLNIGKYYDFYIVLIYKLITVYYHLQYCIILLNL